MDHQRITDDVERLKGEIIQDKEELSTLQSALTEDQEKVESLKDEVSNVQQMQDLARRLRDEIGKQV
jgi:predicted RNase H-like nuclease (RuvC/YqgF family)